jgi:transcriptional regulator
MYIPPHYRKEDPELLLQFMQSHLFVNLISCHENQPHITHLPVVVEKNNDGRIILLSHMAKANPHWKTWNENTKAVAVFQGPHAYISPAHYTSPKNVPTWNYIAVHAKGPIRITGADETLATMDKMIVAYDPAYMDQYRNLDERYREGLLKGVVGFRIVVENLEGKFKLNQNKPEQDARNVINYFEKSTDTDAREMVDYMKLIYGTK